MCNNSPTIPIKLTCTNFSPALNVKKNNKGTCSSMQISTPSYDTALAHWFSPYANDLHLMKLSNQHYGWSCAGVFKSVLHHISTAYFSPSSQYRHQIQIRSDLSTHIRYHSHTSLHHIQHKSTTTTLCEILYRPCYQEIKNTIETKEEWSYYILYTWQGHRVASSIITLSKHYMVAMNGNGAMPDKINIQQSQPALLIFIKVIRVSLIQKLKQNKKRKEIARSGQSPKRKIERKICINRDCLNLQPTHRPARISLEKEILPREMPSTWEQHTLPEYLVPVMSMH